MINSKRKKLLGELLIDRQLITQQQLQIALNKQKEMGEMLGSVLVKLGFIDHEATLLPIVAQQYQMDFIQLKGLTIPEEAIKTVPAKYAWRYGVIPLGLHNGTLTVAINRPNDILVIDDIRMLTGVDIYPILATQKDIVQAIQKHYGFGAEMLEKIMQGKGVEIKEELVEKQQEENQKDEATIGNFLHQVFKQAYQERATDIHIEPFKDYVIVRFRIDGALCDIPVPENIKYFKDAINSRIKIMCNLDIAERRRPQDGRFRVTLNGVALDLRVSFMPTSFGESAVLRILNSTRLLSFPELNLSQQEQDTLKELIRLPYGIIFMTGPTGSGKTTTLYSCLTQINTVDKKIITLEDPIEYQIPNITQIQINPGINLSFARGLRSVLRHDPDVILVGEVRDVETAEIAVQSALTGHLIFSTLHTNNAVGGIARLLNMGVEPYLITSTVECFIAQRLVRVICPKCKKEKKITAGILQKFDIETKNNSDVMVYEGKGCEHCNHTGFYGRTAIFEFLPLDEKINELILKRSSVFKIQEQAIAGGMKTLRQAGWEKVIQGVTTPEEVIRVTQERSRRRG